MGIIRLLLKPSPVLKLYERCYLLDPHKFEP